MLVNRLRRGIRLQVDPTVIYGIGEKFDGNLRKRDLEADTAYNTYVRDGLPPTPIALPSQAALARLRALAAAGPVTLLTATRAIDISQAAVLAELLRQDS